MNKKVKKVMVIVLAAVCGGALLGVGLWRARVAGKSRPAHFVIVRDRSDSVLSGCDCTAALVKRAFTDPHIGASSTVTVIVTGDAETAFEPKLLVKVEVPLTRQVLEGRDAALRQREKLLDDIKAGCEKAVRTKTSPIFISVKRGVEHLRSSGCGPESNCTVYVQTDLEETGDGQIKTALNRNQKSRSALPAPINNEGINVVISGLAETSGIQVVPDGKVRQLTKAHDPQRADRIRSVWQGLFTNPERVTFEPYCPKS